ncbi:hypothetical protein FRC04_000680 [Tulasnella sp. 424]|nr:hypothetical protein FRC04_000680 [Tulasnella sp. 424]KAG8974949.1 hypothetical protein FRC05_006626 [Tulasnella sp. 425]
MFRTAISKSAATALRRVPATPSLFARSSRLKLASPIHPSASLARSYSSSLPARLHSTTSAAQEPVKQQQLNIEPRLSLTFTCAVPDCNHRSTHEFTKRAYTRGLVIIQCPSCKNRHLIADNIGWFKDSEETQGGKLRTVEDFVKAKGETVRRGKQLKVLQDGETVEYVVEDEAAEGVPLVESGKSAP